MKANVLFLIFAVLPLARAAEEKILLRNTGEPLRVAYTCAEDELQSVGLLCTDDEPCPIYLELTALGLSGRKLFLAGNLHSSSATIASVILGSDDTGLTWKEPAPRIRGAALEQLEFYDLDHGWAAGENQYPLPRDPFFLVTTDGGASWRQRPVTEDGGPGSMQRFWFDSAQHGELIIDAGRRAAGGRYLDYESETGGDSWMVRSKTDAAPKIKHPPDSFENPDFRVRAAAGGKSYQVEKRLGEKWEPVASFLIEVASCKVKALELKEPPPDNADAGPQPEKDPAGDLKIGGDGAKAPAKKPAVKAPVKKKDPPV